MGFLGLGGSKKSTSTINQTQTENLTSSGTSVRTNAAAPWLKETYTPLANSGASAGNFIAGLLGIPGGDSTGAQAAFSGYKDMAGYAPALRDMQKGIVGGAAARGLLNSGSTQRGLLKAGADLDQQTFGNFLQYLQGLSSMGMQGAGLIANSADQTDNRTETRTGTSTTKGTTTEKKPGGGLFGSLGSIAGAAASIFSDRRLKENSSEIATLDDGLGVYTFNYIGDDERRIGVMADEVALLRPWALGPTVGGYATVNYGEL